MLLCDGGVSEGIVEVVYWTCDEAAETCEVNELGVLDLYLYGGWYNVVCWWSVLWGESLLLLSAVVCKE